MASGQPFDLIGRKGCRQERRVKEILTRLGDRPGRVHSRSAMEPCPSFEPRHDKTPGETFLEFIEAGCLRYDIQVPHPAPGDATRGSRTRFIDAGGPDDAS